MGVPVGGRPLDRLADLRPTREAAPFARPRAQRRPPRLDQVQVGGGDRLEDELPARMDQRPQQYVQRAMGGEIIEDGRDPLRRRVESAVHLLQDVDPVGDGAASVGRRERRARGWLERAEDGAAAPSPIVCLLGCAHPPLAGGIGADHPVSGMALGRRRPHLVQADHRTLWRWRFGAGDDGPLFSAKAGSTRRLRPIATPCAPGGRRSTDRASSRPIPCQGRTSAYRIVRASPPACMGRAPASSGMPCHASWRRFDGARPLSSAARGRRLRPGVGSAPGARRRVDRL